jgi:PIN domain nuclease of toxin-antitoxin system
VVYIVDTHTLVWFLEGSVKVGPQALKILKDSNQGLVIPSIVLAEVKYLSARGRVYLSLDEVFEAVEHDPRCVIYPLDPSVIEMMPTIFDIHDGIICGTALLYQDSLGEEAKVITNDKAIIESGIIQTVW